MTRIVFSKDQSSNYKQFTCSGHADYGKFGKDIICAAISMLVINTINSLEELCHLKMDVTTDAEKGYIKCILPDHLDEKSIVLLHALVLGLTSVESQYGKKFCKVEFEEV